MSVKFEGELLVGWLSTWINELLKTKGADLFRYKGVLAVKGEDSKFIFQGVGMLFSGGFSDFEWGENETRESRFVFIGRNLDKKELVDGIMACKVEGELRFKVGDKGEFACRSCLPRLPRSVPNPLSPPASVLSLTGNGWFPGVVIETWDEGNPYVEEDAAAATTATTPTPSPAAVPRSRCARRRYYYS